MSINLKLCISQTRAINLYHIFFGESSPVCTKTLPPLSRDAQTAIGQLVSERSYRQLQILRVASLVINGNSETVDLDRHLQQELGKFF